MVRRKTKGNLFYSSNNTCLHKHCTWMWPQLTLTLTHTHTHTHTHTRTHISVNAYTLINIYTHMTHVQPGAVKLVLWRHWMHAAQVHPVTAENQFHCTRLYTRIHKHTHINTHTHSHTHRPVDQSCPVPWRSWSTPRRPLRPTCKCKTSRNSDDSCGQHNY